MHTITKAGHKPVEYQISKAYMEIHKNALSEYSVPLWTKFCMTNSLT